MKITGYSPIRSTGITRNRGAGASGVFADLLSASEAPDASQTGAVGDVSAAAALNNLLALQEISEEDVQRRKLMQQGHAILDVLENLRRQLLTGVVPQHSLTEIHRHLAMQKHRIADPKLLAIIEDIELRAAVELAKLEMAATGAAGAEFDRGTT